VEKSSLFRGGVEGWRGVPRCKMALLNTWTGTPEQSLSRYARDFEPTKPPHSTVRYAPLPKVPEQDCERDNARFTGVQGYLAHNPPPPSIGPYRRPMPRFLGESRGGGHFLMGEVPLYSAGVPR